MNDRPAGLPIETTITYIGGRWKPLILFHLFAETHRFGELRRRLPGLTQQMLTGQLRELERDGLVLREVYAQIPPKVEYSLTPLGRSLEPVLRAMNDWGRRLAAGGVASPTASSAGQASELSRSDRLVALPPPDDTSEIEGERRRLGRSRWRPFGSGPDSIVIPSEVEGSDSA